MGKERCFICWLQACQESGSWLIGSAFSAAPRTKCTNDVSLDLCEKKKSKGREKKKKKDKGAPTNQNHLTSETNVQLGRPSQQLKEQTQSLTRVAALLDLTLGGKEIQKATLTSWFSFCLNLVCFICYQFSYKGPTNHHVMSLSWVRRTCTLTWLAALWKISPTAEFPPI